MDKVYIGKIVSTHGIKGEIRIISNFLYKDKVFRVGKKIIVDDKEYTILSYRFHKKYDMITLEGYHDINEVQFLLKRNVYVDKDSLSLDDNEILDEELLLFKVIDQDGREGVIQEVFFASESNRIIRVLFDREILIPFSSPMIVNIDKEKKLITVQLIEGM